MHGRPIAEAIDILQGDNVFYGNTATMFGDVKKKN